MKKTLVVIDSNPAVQAITIAALRDQAVIVHSLPNQEHVIERVLNMQPDIVLCASEKQGIDPFALCRALIAQQPSREICFVLMTGAEDPPPNKQAKAAGIRTVLPKPFKSDQLRSLLAEELETEQEKAAPTPVLYVAISDAFTHDLVVLFLQKYSIPHQESCGTSEISQLAPNTAANFLITDHAIQLDAEPWLSASYVQIFLITPEDREIPLVTDERLKILLRPLSCVILADALSGISSCGQIFSGQRTEPRDSVGIAARISGFVFQDLLSFDLSDSRNWERIGERVKEEVIAQGRRLLD